MKTLTIAVPTYNMERWLPVTIESCLWQSHKSIEILIVNDGSTDASGEIADRYAKLDSRVRHIHKQRRPRQCAPEGAGRSRWRLHHMA